MTGIIFRGIENKDFSILKFYADRGNRIIPALAFLSFVIVLFGWFYLSAFSYDALVKHALSSVGFISNVVYWREAGYFDPVSHEKWLLHTWSLSVEWQFYVLYPLMLVVMGKFLSLSAMKRVLLYGTVIGFLFCVFVTYRWPSAAYFLLPARAWEMMLGGVAYLYPVALQDRGKKRLELLGLCLIVGSYLFISSEDYWPGYLALFPVLGTFFIIQAQRNDSLITNNFVLQKIGAWSYSIYLWHWPIVVLFYYQYDSNLIGIPLSVLMGFVSYKLLERKRTMVNFSAGGILLGAPFVFVLLTANVNFAIGEQSEKDILDFRYNYSNPDCNFRAYSQATGMQEDKAAIADKCFISDNKSILIHGDSQAQHLFYGLDKEFADFDILQIAAFSCRISFAANKACAASDRLFREQVNTISPSMLILSQRDGYEGVDWPAYLDHLKQLDSVVILGPSPEISMKRLIYRGDVLVTNRAYMDQIDAMFLSADLSESHPNVTYVSMRQLLCEGDNCAVFIDGNNIYADDSHFSKFGSEYVINKLRNTVAFAGLE